MVGAAKAIFGLAPDEPVTFERFLGLVHPEDRERVRDVIEHALHPEIAGGYDVDYRCVCDDGTTRWVHAKGRVIFEGRGDDRRPVRFVGTLQDITSRKEAQAQLTEAKEAAETASLAKDKFLAALSHELRTPLAPVVTAVALMEMTPDLPPEMQEYLAMIRRNIALETRLIDDLLDLSRVISGKLRLDRRPAHLNDLVEHVMDIVGGEVHDKGLTLETTLGARPDLVDVDPARLQQVVWNLLKNAAKFTPPGGTIRVATRSAGEGRVEVAVSDTGKGIQPRGVAAHLRPVRAGGPGDHAAVRRAGAGPVDRQGGGGPARRDDPGGQRRAGRRARRSWWRCP